MWLTRLSVWACSLTGVLCGFDVPSVVTIQAAYEREAAGATRLHDPGLMVLEATCNAGSGGHFLCQVMFVSKEDPTERLYFDIVAVERSDKGWQLKSGLCKR